MSHCVSIVQAASFLPLHYITFEIRQNIHPHLLIQLVPSLLEVQGFLVLQGCQLAQWDQEVQDLQIVLHHLSVLAVQCIQWLPQHRAILVGQVDHRGLWGPVVQVDLFQRTTSYRIELLAYIALSTIHRINIPN